MENTKLGWDFYLEGNYEMAYQVFTADIINDPNTESISRINRGKTLILLNRPIDALKDFQWVISDNPSAAIGYICAGVANVWCNDYISATKNWQTGFHSKYADPAGGILSPAFVYYAGVKLSNHEIIQRGLTRLKSIWIPRVNSPWPGAISGFILGDLTEEELFVQANHRNPTLLLKRVTQSNFWVAIRYYEQRNFNKWEEHMNLAGKGYNGEIEFLLATYELFVRGAKNNP
jgi:lipoprotein NlpI